MGEPPPEPGFHLARRVLVFLALLALVAAAWWLGQRR
jgi:hypothetical protein